MSVTRIVPRPPASRTATVLLVADEGPVAHISRLLESEQFDMQTFPSASAMLCDLRTSNPIILLWVQDATSQPLSCIEPLTRRHGDTPLVVLCPSIARWGIRAALAAGAAGVLLESDLDAALGPSLRAVLAGQACVPREYSRQMQPPALSTREKQILGLVVMGFTNGQIAQQLFLAESTVKSHLSSAFGKLGVRSRNDAVQLILDPDRGLGMGILTLVGEPVEAPAPSTAVSEL